MCKCVSPMSVCICALPSLTHSSINILSTFVLSHSPFCFIPLLSLFLDLSLSIQRRPSHTESTSSQTPSHNATTHYNAQQQTATHCNKRHHRCPLKSFQWHDSFMCHNSYTDSYIYMYIHTHMITHIYILYAFMYVSIYLSIYIYIYIVYIYMYIYTQLPLLLRGVAVHNSGLLPGLTRI